MRRPLLIPLTATIGGILLATFFSFPPFLPLSCLLVALGALLYTRRRFPVSSLLLIALISFFTAFLHMQLLMMPPRDHDHVSWFVNQGVTHWEGVITELPTYTDGKATLPVALFRRYEGEIAKPVHGSIFLTLKSFSPFYPGDVIHFQTQLRPIKGFHNPGAFDYEEYLHERGIWARGFISRPSMICLLRSGYDYPLLSSISRYRAKLREAIYRYASFPAATILEASLLGTEQAIPPELREKFNRTGTSHIIAISGFNVGIVAAFAAFACRFLISLYPPLLLHLNLQLISALVAGSFVLFYTFIAGTGISVLRSTIMILLFIFALILGRIRMVENALFLAALIMLLFAPHLLFDLSFQLSFSAVYALICLVPPLMERLRLPETLPPFAQKLIRASYAFLVTTTCATLGTLPIIIDHFHRVSPLVLLSNLLLVPLLGLLVVPLVTLLIVTLPLSTTLTQGVISLASHLVTLSITLVDLLSSLPYASLLLPQVGAGQIFLYLAALVTFALGIKAVALKRRYLAASGLFLILLILSFFFLLPIALPRPCSSPSSMWDRDSPYSSAALVVRR